MVRPEPTDLAPWMTHHLTCGNTRSHCKESLTKSGSHCGNKPFVTFDYTHQYTPHQPYELTTTGSGGQHKTGIPYTALMTTSGPFTIGPHAPSSTMQIEQRLQPQIIPKEPIFTLPATSPASSTLFRPPTLLFHPPLPMTQPLASKIQSLAYPQHTEGFLALPLNTATPYQSYYR